MIYKDYLLNVVVVLSPLLFIQHAYKVKEKRWLQPLVIYFIFLVPLLFTMSFPVKMFSTLLDLRGIPLIIGSMYGGPLTLALLSISLIIYRDIIGNITTISYLIALLPTLILIFIAYKKFEELRFRNKVIVVIGLCLFLRTTVVMIYHFIEGNQQTIHGVLVPSLPIIIAQSLLAGLCVYIIEAIRNNIRLKEEVISTEKMKIVSEIAASVAHEVRNPLTSVRGFIQMLGENNLTEEKRKNYRDICLEELNRAQEIISDYLSMAKPEQEKTELIDLRDEIIHISNILSPYANYQNVQIVYHIENDITLSCIRTRFRQAMINLGKNAIEAMPNGGLLEFRGIMAKDNVVELFIMDKGSGMSSEQIRRLGTPYYSTKDKGTGLGTMVSFNIIRQMGGKIEINSKVEEGTTYKILFPSTNS